MKLLGSPAAVLSLSLFAGCGGFLVPSRLPVTSPTWRKGEGFNTFASSRGSDVWKLISGATSRSGGAAEGSDDPIAFVKAEIERVNDDLEKLGKEEELIEDGLLRSEGPYAGEGSSFLKQQLVAVQGKDASLQQEKASLRREKEIFLAKMAPINEGRPPVPVAALDWRGWLDARGWWRTRDDNDEDVRLMAIDPTSGSVPLPFVGREEQLFQMWMFLHSNYEDLHAGDLPVGRPAPPAQRT
ncbi:unnamed protein product, partial [Phaeothamnion confervicola]